MPLALAAPLVAGPRAAPPRQLLLGGRGGRLAVDLDDQHLAVVLGQGAVAEVDVGGPGQAQDPLLDRRGRRRGPQEHPPESAGDPEAHPGGQPAEPADDQRAVGVAGQAQRDVQGMHAGPAAVARHEEGPDIGDRPATGLERPLGGGVRHAIAAGLVQAAGSSRSWRARRKSWISRHPSDRRSPSRAVSNSRKDAGPGSFEAVGDDLVEPLMGLLLQLVDVSVDRPRRADYSDRRSWGPTPDRSRLGHVDQRSG